MDTYHIDLERIDLDEYWDSLRAARLMPGRKVLHEDMDARLAALEAAGITNLLELAEALKTKQRLAAFAKHSGLDEEYLVVLRREAGSLTPNPVPLDRFPDVSEQDVKTLAKQGVRNSKQLWENPGQGPAELYELSDLVRINGVGPVFAQMLRDVGVCSVAELAQCRAGELFRKLVESNAETKRTRAKFSEPDFRLCVETAAMLAGAIKE